MRRTRQRFELPRLAEGLGLEFVSDPNDDLMFVQKDGINAGTSALLRYYPGADLTIVLLSNTSDGVWAPGRAMHAMIRAL